MTIHDDDVAVGMPMDLFQNGTTAPHPAMRRVEVVGFERGDGGFVRAIDVRDEATGHILRAERFITIGPQPKSSFEVKGRVADDGVTFEVLKAGDMVWGLIYPSGAL